MRYVLERVLELQRSWNARSTAPMRERGRCVRHDAVAWLAAHDGELSSAMGIPAVDFLSEGGDGTGSNARVAWTRFASAQHSPRPTDGFMVAYLWAFPPENAVYLSLLQGVFDTAVLRNQRELVRRPIGEIRAHRQWAQGLLTNWAQGRGDLVPLRLRDTREQSPGRGYELGSVASIRYAADAIPDDAHLLADALDFGRALGIIYRAAPPPPPGKKPATARRSWAVGAAQPTLATGIQVGTTVEATDLDTQKRRTWRLVAKRDVNRAADELSAESPIGQAMLGHDVGEVVSVSAPRGMVRYLIEHRTP
jgi:hypothetical protein